VPEPLHPAMVHFAIVFAILLPISAIAALWATRRGAHVRLAWTFPFGLALALTLSAFVAVRTGEAEEDRVEAVVGEAILHEHEEAGERFLVLAGVLTLIAATGFVGGTVGTAGRGITAVGAVVLAAAAFQVGAMGGELVYRHGAAAAYTGAAAGIDRDTPEALRRERSEDRDH
jgi:uncharacterized membrane protein